MMIKSRGHRLLDELEQGLSRATDGDDGTVGWKIYDYDDKHSLIIWNGFILGPAETPFENVTYNLKIMCGMKYPDDPPIVKFITRVNMTCVNEATGVVDTEKFPILAQWQPENTILVILAELRRMMTLEENVVLAQSPEGTTF